MQSSGISLAVTSIDAQASHKIPFPHHTIWFGRGNSVDTGSLTRPPFYPDWRKPSWICHPSVTQGPRAGRPGCRADPHLGHRLFHSQVFFLAGFLSMLGLGMLQAQGVEHFCPSDILWRLPQEKEGAWRQESGSHFQFPPQDTERQGRQGRDQNVEGWTGGVKGIWGPSITESPTRGEAGLRSRHEWEGPGIINT